MYVCMCACMEEQGPAHPRLYAVRVPWSSCTMGFILGCRKARPLVPCALLLTSEAPCDERNLPLWFDTRLW